MLLLLLFLLVIKSLLMEGAGRAVTVVEGCGSFVSGGGDGGRRLRLRGGRGLLLQGRRGAPDVQCANGCGE